MSAAVDTLNFAVELSAGPELAAGKASANVAQLAKSMVKAESDAAKFAAAQVKAANALDQINAKGNASFQVQQQKNIGALVLNAKKASDAQALAQLKSQLKNEEVAVKASLQQRARDAAVAAKSAKLPSLPGGGGGAAPTPAAALPDFAATIGEISGPIGMLTTVAASAAVAVGALTLAAEGFALAQADQKRDLQLSLEAMLGSAEAGKQMESQFQSLAQTLPISRDHIDSMGKALINAGQRGTQLTDTLKALATVESTAGAEGAGKLQNMIEKWNVVGHFEVPPAKALAGTGITIDLLNQELARKTGQSVETVKNLMKAGKITVEQGTDALNAVITNKLGDVAAKKMLGISQQFEKGKEAIGNLFEDIKIEGFLVALSKIGKIFDDTTSTGKALKASIEGVLNRVTDLATAALPYVEIAIKGIIIAALQFYIAIKPALDRWDESFGNADDNKSGFLSFMEGVGTAASIVGVILGGLVDQIRFLYDNVVAPFIAIEEFFFGVAVSIEKGLINGLLNAGASINGAMHDLAMGALDSFKKTLGIASPSKEFAKLGHFSGVGFAQGMDKAVANDVAPSVNDMIGGPQAAAAGGGGGNSGPAQVTLNMEFHGVSKDDAEAIGNEVQSKIVGYFDSTALSSGTAGERRVAA